jgi:hypothetical protein
MPDTRVSQAKKRRVAERAGNRCEYCRSLAGWGPDPFSIEHIIPKCRGGTDDLDNLAFACQGCNNHKSTAAAAYDPTTGSETNLYHPRNDRWEDHFSWSDDLTEVVPLTPTGRVTLARLRMNRSGLMNHRKALTAFGVHPPLSDRVEK